MLAVCSSAPTHDARSLNFHSNFSADFASRRPVIPRYYVFLIDAVYALVHSVTETAMITSTDSTSSPTGVSVIRTILPPPRSRFHRRLFVCLFAVLAKTTPPTFTKFDGMPSHGHGRNR